MTKMDPEVLIREIESDLEAKGLLSQEDDEEPEEPATRVVELEPWHDAVFVGAPICSLALHRLRAPEPMNLPYFDPTGKTDEELRTTIMTYLTHLALV